MVSASFLADFSSFQAAVAAAEVKLKSFESGAAGVEKALARVGNSFSGQKILSEATLAVKAVTDIGGASKLTEAEQKRLNGTLTEAIAKYQALGQTAPKSMIDLEVATRKAVSTHADLGAKLEQIGASSRTLGTVLLPVSAALVGAGAASTLFSSKFEASMTRLVTLSGVSQGEIAGVKQHILDLAPAVGIGPQALADAMMKVSSTVSDTGTALGILDTAAQATKAGFGETIDVAGALTTVVNSYGAANITAARAGDILAQAVKEGGAEAKELAPTLANVVPFAAQLGVSFEEVAANIATLTKLGVPTAEAVTSLASVFSALTKETDQGTKALGAMGMSYADIRKAVKDNGLATTLTELKERFGDNIPVLMDVFGRIEAVKNIMGTAGVQAGTYAEVLQKVKGSSDSAGGAMQGMADAMSGKQVQSWNELIAKVQVIAIQFGDKLAPALANVVSVATPVLDWVQKAVGWFGELPGPVQLAGIGFLAVVAAAGPLLFALGTLITSVMSVTAAFVLLTGGTALGGVAAAAVPAAAGIAMTGAVATTSAVGVGIFSSALVVLYGTILPISVSLAVLYGAFKLFTGSIAEAKAQGDLYAIGADGYAVKTNVAAKEVKKHSEVSNDFGKAMAGATAEVTKAIGEQQKGIVATGAAVNATEAHEKAIKKLAEAIKKWADIEHDMHSVGVAETKKFYDEQVKAATAGMERQQDVIRKNQALIGTILADFYAAEVNRVRAGEAAKRAEINASGEAEIAYYTWVKAQAEAFAKTTREIANDNALRQMAKDAGVSIDELVPKVKGLGTSWASVWHGMKGAASSTLGDLNSVFQSAFEGGGNIGGAFKSLATNALSNLATLIPGVGPIIAQFSGAIIAGLSKLGSLFGFGKSEGRQEVDRNIADIKKLQDELLKTQGSLDNIRTKGGAAGEALAGAWKDTSLVHFKGLLDEFNLSLEHTKAVADLYNDLLGTDSIQGITNLQEAWAKLTPEQLANEHILENLITKYEGLRDSTGVVIPGLEEMAQAWDTNTAAAKTNEDQLKNSKGTFGELTDAMDIFQAKIGNVEAVDKLRTAFEDMRKTGKYSLGDITSMYQGLRKSLGQTPEIVRLGELLMASAATGTFAFDEFFTLFKDIQVEAGKGINIPVQFTGDNEAIKMVGGKVDESQRAYLEAHMPQVGIRRGDDGQLEYYSKTGGAGSAAQAAFLNDNPGDVERAERAVGTSGQIEAALAGQGHVGTGGESYRPEQTGSNAKGGIVPTWYLALGGSPWAGGPRGTDTVPSWLTPGEGILNVQNGMRLLGPSGLDRLNKGEWPDGMLGAESPDAGGIVPRYLADGNLVPFTPRGADSAPARLSRRGVAAFDTLQRGETPQGGDIAALHQEVQGLREDLLKVMGRQERATREVPFVLLHALKGARLAS